MEADAEVVEAIDCVVKLCVLCHIINVFYLRLERPPPRPRPTAPSRTLATEATARPILYIYIYIYIYTYMFGYVLETVFTTSHEEVVVADMWTGGRGGRGRRAGEGVERGRQHTEYKRQRQMCTRRSLDRRAFLAWTQGPPSVRTTGGSSEHK